MSWRRVVARNGLGDGDYGTPPLRWRNGVNVNESEDGEAAVGKARREKCEHYEAQASALAGDLRRLERDALDEGAICQLIADRTGIHADMVAAVLQEFLA